MSVTKGVLILVIWFINTTNGFAQRRDSTFHKFTAREFIVPTVLIGTGLVMMLPGIKAEQQEWRQRYFDYNTTVDNVLQYTPSIAALSLGLTGIKSKHNFGDRLAVLLISNAIMTGTVFGLKNLTHIERPDNSSDDSFPSGHTATAFTGAAVLAEEYGGTSVWYSVGGYTLACVTGSLRMVNNRHWLSDVCVGAAVGILSAKAAYAIYPWIKRKFAKRLPEGTSIVPMYDGRTAGLMINVSF